MRNLRHFGKRLWRRAIRLVADYSSLIAGRDSTVPVVRRAAGAHPTTVMGSNGRLDSFDVIVIGAGPTGLACAIDAKRAGFTTANIDKGCLVNSLFNYPAHMTFFTTPELLVIGDIPFPSPNQKPTRQEALEYYREVAAHYQLTVKQYHRVEKVTGHDGDFCVHAVDFHDRPRQYHARKLIIST